MSWLILALHVSVSIFLIFVILLQPGKGDSMSALGGGGGGGGATNTVFGGSGSVTFLAKVTEVCAVIFMVTSLTLAYRSSHSSSVLRAHRNLAAQSAAQGKAPALPAAGGTTAPATGPSSPAVPAPAQSVPAKK